MASTSTADINAIWQKGDSCLAPSPRDGVLQEAKIQRLISTPHNNDTMALVVFTSRDEEDDVGEEEAVPVSRLQRPGSNHFTQEKPLFSSSLKHTRASVPLVLSQSGGDVEKVPYTINRYLRDYQREGIRFIYGNYTRSRGCILGDDMGLGKTVQVIGFLAAVLHKTGTWEDIVNSRPQFLLTQIPSGPIKPNKVFLIVAPLSVLYNWKDELDTWGHFQCVVVHGLRKEEELTRIRKGRSEIALTTYETLRLCLDQFNSIGWSAVIVDEAHKLKNPNSQITQAMKELKCQVRVGLTGTILQNNLEELWCVMDWAIPGCLGSLGHFKNNFSDPIEQGQRHNATKRALATGRKAVRALARKISHWFLRRTKTLIKEQLPKKDDRVVFCSLTDFQQTVYQTVLDTEDVTLLLSSSEKCDCRSGRTRRSCCYETNSEGVKMKELYFSYLAILRKVANHVALLQSTAGTSKKQKKYVSAVCEKVFQKFPDFVRRCKQEAFEAMSDPAYSGKMKVLQKLLKHYAQRRDKVLLFSLSTKLLDVLEGYCMAEGLDYSRLDGTTKSKERVKIVKEFNSCPQTNLCLVSTMAGGLGLNFVGANVVVLFDPTWNPANDLQAIDRAYRIGQYRDVTVLRLISLGTVEEVIYLRQVYKQQLQCSVVGRESARRYFEAVQGPDGHKGELFGTKNLFRLQTQGTCLTHKILEEPGDALPINAPKLSDETAKENRDASGIPGGVLDFSSGSEDDEEAQGARRKAPDPSRADETGGVNASTGPGRLSLLQHGFSRLLQGVAVRPGSGVSDSSQNEGASGEENNPEDEKDGGVSRSSANKEGTFSGVHHTTPGNGPVQVPKSKMNYWDISSGSDGEDGRKRVGGRQEGRERPDLKERTERKKRTVGGEIKTSPNKDPYKAKIARVHHFQGYSDESEDLDIEVMTRPRMVVLNPQGGQGDRGKDSIRKRRTSTRDRARSKHTEDIETFTSSDEEHTPVKRGRSRGRHGGQRDGQRERAEGHEVPEMRDGAGSERRPERPRTVSFTGLKTQTSPASKGLNGTIDNVLGGVREVAHTHSNQRVVGGSKAEERISRAAVRDVFKRRMYSQLPANHLLGTQESLSESPPDSPPGPAAVGAEPAAPGRSERRSADHPVAFTAKTVHRTRHTTFIIGQTPQTIRRRQLEEMAAQFKSSSVGQFAEEVLRSSSTRRLAWLRQYYASLDRPDLANAVTNTFPQPTSERTTRPPSPSTDHSSSSSVPPPPPHGARTKRTSQKAGGKTRTSEKSVSELQKKPRTPSRNILEAPCDVSVPESGEQEENVSNARGRKRTRRVSVYSSGASRAGGGLGSDKASSSGLGPGEAAAFLDRRDRYTPSSPDLSHGRSTAPSRPIARGMERELKSPSRTDEAVRGQSDDPQPPSAPRGPPSAPGHRSLLTDLIGDTSILDDLFRRQPRGVQQTGRPKTAPTSTSALVTSKRSTASPSGGAPSTDTGTSALTRPPSSPTAHARTARPVTPPPRSRGSRKDFWDILNEGNEESINRLTDLSEVERVCVNTNLTARTRARAEERGSTGLWKTNERFLWKK
ncbi:DNA excision repair protein ERCC-6-like 2 isoform 2-T2 [Polymixia lowei]